MTNQKFKVQEEAKEAGYAKLVLEPLEPGFGQTLGVALRRVLLANIEGSAVTSVKIDKVKHMFSTLPGLKEDVIELILNIKNIRVKLPEGRQEGKMILSKVGPGEVKVEDIETTDGVEVVNKDHYLGSLSDKKTKLDIEFTVEKGYGYSLAEERKATTVGIIPIDAIFSPITKVNYKVEQTRVGRQTNFDKLVLEIWTDGTINPKEAVEQAAKVLVSQFIQVYEPQAEVDSDQIAISSTISEDILKMTVDELDLPTRIYNSLRNAGIETIGQLLGTPKKELMGYRNLGAKSLSIIEEGFKQKGIPFNI